MAQSHLDTLFCTNLRLSRECEPLTLGQSLTIRNIYVERICRRFILGVVFGLSVGHTSTSSAQVPNDFTIEGRLYDTSGVPLGVSGVDVMLEVLNESDANCVLYREVHSGLDLSSSNPTSQGVFSVRLGIGAVSLPS